MMDNRYEVIINWSDEDECYIAEVPDLPGCMADGSSYQEAAKHAESAIQDWIEIANSLGRAIPDPKERRKSA